MKSEIKQNLKEIKALQAKIEKDFLENEKEISKIENEVEDLEILDNFFKAIQKVEKLKKEAEEELNVVSNEVESEKINFDKRI